MDLFDYANKDAINLNKPLAERLRPRNLSEFVGQKHIVGVGSFLYRAIKTDKVPSCIFYGPPGSGKTTLANIIALATNANFVKLNAVSSGVADAKKVIEEAKQLLKTAGKRTYLLLDECHRWSKSQSDCVLGAIEDGTIIFIGSTTENPLIAMTRAIVSRCTVFEFKRLDNTDIIEACKRAVNDSRGLKNYDLTISDEAVDYIAHASNGDLRTALNSLELAVISAVPDANGKINVTLSDAKQSLMKKVFSVDDSLYYDMLSAFCKSLRGSDADAAVYWALRMLKSGVDPLMIARRLFVHSAEDVGMADPRAQLMAASALQAVQNIGLPECKIPLVNAIIYVAEAPKSNSVIRAIGKAEELIEKCDDDSVPYHLRDNHYTADMTKEGYLYPHDFGGWVEQQYLPDEIANEKIYVPSNNGAEKDMIRAKVSKRNKG